MHSVHSDMQLHIKCRFVQKTKPTLNSSFFIELRGKIRIVLVTKVRTGNNIQNGTTITFLYHLKTQYSYKIHSHRIHSAFNFSNTLLNKIFFKSIDFSFIFFFVVYGICKNRTSFKTNIYVKLEKWSTITRKKSAVRKLDEAGDDKIALHA